MMALDEPVVGIGWNIVERVAGKVITVPDPNGRLIHAGHWQGGRRGWHLISGVQTLRQVLEEQGP